MGKYKHERPECTDYRSLTQAPCRASDFSGPYISCKALTDTLFDGDVCPFYKTKAQFQREYKASNKFKMDPYMFSNQE